jgi:hypothetical protein
MILYDSSAGRKVESFQYSQSYTRSAGGHGTGRRVSFPSGRVSRSIRGIADSCLVVERRRTSDPFRFIRGIQTRRDPGRPASTCAIYVCGGVTVCRVPLRFPMIAYLQSVYTRPSGCSDSIHSRYRVRSIHCADPVIRISFPARVLRLSSGPAAAPRRYP